MIKPEGIQEVKYSGKTTTAIIIFPEERILLVKRLTVPFRGYWALPGGKLDAGEHADHAVVREVKEETGLDVKIVRKIGEYQESGVQDGIKYDFRATCFLVTPVKGYIKRQEREIKDIKLMSLDEVPEKLAFEHAKMIRDYAQEQ